MNTDPMPTLKWDENGKVVNLNQKESVMNNVTKKIKDVVETGKYFVKNPKHLGMVVAAGVNEAERRREETIKKVQDKKDQAVDVVKLSFALVKEGLAEVRRGYKMVRNQEQEEVKPVDKSSI